jgi:hypothetical protein
MLRGLFNIEEFLVQILEYLKIYLTNPLILVPVVWVIFGYIACWFILSAKKHQPISHKEATLLWKSHKQFGNCKSKKFEKILKGKKIIGYKCQCGYEHKQKRPIINFGV